MTQLKLLKALFERESALGTLKTEIIEALKTIVSQNINFSLFLAGILEAVQVN